MKAIQEWDERGYAVSAGCNRRFKGLTTGHAYSVLAMYELNGEKVLKMRNPWASERYKGPWSDKDRRWTPELRAKVGSVKANDGIFFFPAKKFRRVFS